MPVTLFQAYLPGVDKLELAAGDGLSSPIVTGANCWRINSIHIDFDRAMMVKLPEGLVGESSSYEVYETANPSNKLTVMRVIIDRRYPTLAEVFVHGMVHNADYTIEVVSDVLDEYGSPIDHDNDSATFIGQGHQVPSPGGLSLFIGLDAGVQRLTETNWRPDLDPPYLENPDPLPGAVNVPTDYVPSFDLKDDGSGVRPSATRIWVNSTLIYQDGISYGIYTVVVTPIVGGYHYDLTHSGAGLPNAALTVRVYGEDLAYTPNVVDTDWTFEVAAFRITGLSKTTFDDNGGEEFTIYGVWDADLETVIRLGPLGTVDDPPCYFGQGYGQSRLSPDNGEMTCWTPHGPTPGVCYLTITIGTDTITLATELFVVERVRRVKVNSVFACVAPWVDRQKVPR